LKKPRYDSWGFTLPEVLLAVAILALTLFALISVAASSLQTRAKSNNLATAQALAETTVESVIRKAQSDADPAPKSKSDFWESDFQKPGPPWEQKTVKVGTNEFRCEVYTKTIVELGGSGLEQNRIKRVDVTVYWWGGEQTGSRAGSGKLSVALSRLVNEVPDAP
jgi:uncharacterized protein (TIGR02598 family)